MNKGNKDIPEAEHNMQFELLRNLAIVIRYIVYFEILVFLNF